MEPETKARHILISSDNLRTAENSQTLFHFTPFVCIHALCSFMRGRPDQTQYLLSQKYLHVSFHSRWNFNVQGNFHHVQIVYPYLLTMFAERPQPFNFLNGFYWSFKRPYVFLVLGQLTIIFKLACFRTFKL